MKSKWFTHLAVATITLLAGLVTLEVGARIIEPKNVLRETFEQPHPELHHRFVPNSSGNYKSFEFNAGYKINSLGLRDRELPIQKPPHTKRLLLLGDSFTEGNGVEAADAFPARLQALVDGAGLQTHWEVINAGEGSYSPLLHYLLLDKQLKALEPDLVVLNLDLSDFYDDLQYTRLATFDASGKPTGVSPEPERARGDWHVEGAYAIKDFLKENFRAYNFLRRHIAAHMSQRPPVSVDVGVDKYAMLRDGYKFGSSHELELTLGYIDMIRDLLAARGCPLWIAVYPYGHQVSAREWNSGRTFWSFEQNRVYSHEPQKAIESLLQKRGIYVVNMTDDFVERSKTEFPLYFPYDGHFTPSGHAVAAQALMSKLLPFLQKS